MVFTNTQITSFFEDRDQMGLSNRTRVYLQGEGITDPSDLLEFVDKDAWLQIVETCKRPPQVPGPGAPPNPALVSQQPFQLPAKSLLRLKVASKVVEYYDRTERTLTASSMMWSRLANFKVEWDTLVDRKKKNDELTLPTVTKSLPIVPFFEAYDTFVEEFIGQAGCPLKWIYRENDNVVIPAPAQMPDQPYSVEHGSVAGEMVARLSHANPLYRVDNATGYSQLVTATLGTAYASTIAPFKRSRDGRGALLALKAQFAGPAHWDREVRNMNDFLLTNKWTGTTGFTLHQFLAKHRSSYNSLQRCAEHVAVELPNERTRVGYLLENIDCNDKNVTTALSHIRLDDTVDAAGTPSGLRNEFEGAVAFLLPTDPVKKKRGVKRTPAQISATSGVGSPDKAGKSVDKKGKNVRFKSSYGKTGVELRYYKQKEWAKLSKEQQSEVIEYRKKNSDYDKKSPATTVNKSTIAAMIADAVSKREEEQAKSDAFKQDLVSDLKGMIESQIAVVIANGAGAKKPLQRAIASTNASATDAKMEGAEDAAERCAASLMDKFRSMGSKANGKKTG